MFDTIVALIERSGYLGIAALMLAENVFPPIPSELIMPFAGFAAARGELSLAGVVLSGVLGTLAGAVFWYAVGRALGLQRLERWAARHGRWLTLAPTEIASSGAWFRRHGATAVLLGRLLPAIRTLISVPAGVAAMSFGTFMLYTSIGTIVWTSVPTMCGYALESRYELVAGLIDPVTTVVVVTLVAIYLYRVVTFGSRRDKRDDGLE